MKYTSPISVALVGVLFFSVGTVLAKNAETRKSEVLHTIQYLKNHVRPCVKPGQRAAIVCDGFESYSIGSILGQGGWTNYVNGQNYSVTNSEPFRGRKALVITAQGDNVLTKKGAALSDGLQTVWVKSLGRAGWGSNLDGNMQVRVSKNSWAGGTDIFAAVSFKKDGNVAYYNLGVSAYLNFATYADNTWTKLDIQWRSSDKSARYRVNNGTWTPWHVFTGSATFTNFDYVGFDFNQTGGTGAAMFDTLR